MNSIAFISNGKGLPEYFREDLVMIAINLHDMCKSVDWVTHLAKKILNEEGYAEVLKLRETVYVRIKDFNKLEMIAWNCQQQKREMNAKEIEFIKNYIETNEKLVEEYLNTLNEDHTNKN